MHNSKYHEKMNNRKNPNTRNKAELSSIHYLRLFHNWIKKQLITNAVEYLEKPDIKLLDLAVGKGGDINKWVSNKIKYVVGFDINKKSIDEAKERYRQMNIAYDYKFYELDLSQESSIDRVKNITNTQFNIVSCQFAIHYFFKNDDTLNTILTIVSNSLKSGGIFIGTTMDGGIIKNNVNTQFGNDLYTIKKSDNNKYTVSLGKKDDKDHYFVDYDSEEYYVELERFKSVAQKHGLYFVGIIDFKTWFNKYDGKLTDNEKEFSFMNISFMFVKN